MEKLWTTAEVARFLGITELDVEQLVREGKLTGYRLGGQFLRFRPAQVKELKGLVNPPPQETAVTALEPERWQEQVRDFVYFHDFYIMSVVLLVGLVLYLLSSG